MRRTVIIAGAGATLAEALPSKPKKQETPPLDATFFKLCAASGYRGQRLVREYMERQFGIINPFADPTSMEEVFNYIYTDAFSSRPSSLCFGAYWALIEMYRFALMSTTNGLVGNSRSGVGHLLRTLFEHDSARRLAFITFNQDLVIEKAIQHTKSMAKYRVLPWSISHAYNMTFQSIVGVASGPHPFDDAADTSTEVLKMHGSLNWVYRVRSGSDPKNSIRGHRGNPICVNDQTIWPRLTMPSRGSSRSRTSQLLPLLVPPVFEKNARYGDALQLVWDRASEVLSEADDLIIFGYSFPDADFAAKATLRQSLKQNQRLKTIHVIDENPLIAGKIAAIASADSCHFYSSVARFRATYPGECK